jgi:phosphate transport system ATP-binding protein
MNSSGSGGGNRLSVRNLDFYYGKLQALKNITADFPDQKVTALIGPSGCGKSTLLRIFNRIFSLYPGQRATGKVILDGEDILPGEYDVNSLRARVGMVMQKPTPFPMSVFDNVAYGVRLHESLKHDELVGRVQWALEKAAFWDEVKDRLKENAMQLSGGQQQRLCIARTIATRPELICMDEATSALDPRSTAKVEELLLELKRDFMIVIVTHNMQQANRISDLTGFMYLGELVEFGETKQIFEDPQDEKTREYVRGLYG